MRKERVPPSAPHPPAAPEAESSPESPAPLRAPAAPAEAQGVCEDAAAQAAAAPGDAQGIAAVAAEPSAETPPLQPPPKSLAQEAEEFCAALEQFFRRTLGQMPSSLDLAELHAQQAAVRDLLERAAQSGAGAQQRVGELTGERDRYKEAATRTRADFLNYQTRAANDLKRAEEQALRAYLLDLLPILDSLGLALADARSDQASLSRVKAALEVLAQGFDQALKVRGLERIQSVGKPYDAALHEAVATRPADPAKGEAPGQVVEEFRPGYLWKGLLLRPAQVFTTVAPPAK